jgi:radical SAM protein with 4Fe4S-binding SPASM domain
MTEEEPLLRGRGVGGRAVWNGCPAGRTTLAIGADGAVRACVALSAAFETASLRERSLSDVWHDDRCFPVTRGWTPAALEGRCARCAFGRRCRAGCPAVAYGITGTVGLDPLCLRAARRP